ncbi:uncharacterized protein BXZ73DRAFT_57259 [Epithele typhae]|uniref:uncharacterized protein n=1 Tax=Epithele typhae TaxID=378194 RepID=UPI0020072391|nr:uncharacterized protein BXZ73DRAFT_57259 [Epithele typhae]KAH9911236.1 hypothetical protein BXZ73DRAFT_57259 [Epithele typhae]
MEDLASIYNNAVRPAVVHAVPEHAAHWPATFEMALNLVRGRGNVLHGHSVGIPADSLPLFSAKLRELLSQSGPSGWAIFMIELRGTKEGNPFNFTDQYDRQAAFYKFTESFILPEDDAGADADDDMPLDARARPQWYVDVAVELSRPGHVLQWHRSQHPDILRYLFPSMDEDRAKKVVKFNSFYVDVNAHIHRLAGFRYQPRSPVNNIVYANIYTTDKTVIYQLHPGVFRPRTGEDLLPRKINALDQDMDSISAQFHSAAGLTPAPEDAEVHSDDSDEDRPVRMMPSQDGAARAEVRVRVSAFSSVLRVFTQQELENFVVTYRNNEWW